MTATIPTGYCEAQVAIRNTLNSHVSSISLGFFAPADPDGFNNVAGALSLALPDIAQDMVDEYFMTGVRITFPDGSGGTGSIDSLFDSPILGANGSDLMDPRSAMVINKRSVRLGRKGRGRFFLPGVNEEDVTTSGTFSTSFSTTVNNHLGTFLDKLVSPASPLTPAPPYLLHSDGTTPTAIDHFDLSPLVGRVRRRA